MSDRSRLLTEVADGLVALRRHAAGTSAHACPAKGLPTRAQFGILMFLSHAGPQHAKDLAHRMCISPSAATQLVNALVKDKLVSRSPDAADKRQIRLALTAAGKRRLSRARTHMIAAFAAHLSSLTDAELREWRRLQQKVLTSTPRS